MPNAKGDLEILNTKLMNVALMFKWAWKIVMGDQGLWG
jgi:hypothetical protein